MSVLKVQGALLRGTENLWIGVRNYSSTRAKKEACKRWVCEQNELLEVLEARVKQLKTENISEVVVDKVHLPPLRKNSLLPPSPPGVAACSPSQDGQMPKGAEKNSAKLSRWNEKLQKEDNLKYKRFLRLQNKILNVVPEQRKTQKSVEKRTTNPKRYSEKSQPPNLTKTFSSNIKAAAVQQFPENRKDSAKEKLLPKTEHGTEHGNLQSNILSYLDTCLYLGLPERALNCLLFYHRSAVRRTLLDIRMYNLLLHDYAKKPDIVKVGHLFHLLEEAGLRANSDSYVAALSCMGRSSARSKIITGCLQQLARDGLQLEDLFHDTLYEGEEVEMALKAIRQVRPDFQLSPLSQAKMPDNPLLRGFYTKERPVSYPKLDFTAQELQEKFEKQMQVEASDTITIDSVEATKPLSEQTIKARKLLADLRPRWQASLLASLKESKMSLDQKNSGQLSLYPFLCVLQDEEYVEILLRNLSVLPAQGDSLVVLAKRLGLEVYNKYITWKKSRSPLVKNVQHLYKGYAQLLAKDTQVAGYLPREYWEKLATEAGWNPWVVAKEYAWPNSLLVQLGLHLVEMLVQVVKMENNLFRPGLEQKLIPVVYHVYSFRSGHQIGFIRPHPLLTRLFADAAESALTFEASVLPMLCPPLPWVSPHSSPYIFSPTKLMRSLDGVVQHQVQLERCPPGTLNPVMDALNSLGACPWKVNKPILDLVVSIFNDKGNKKLDVPPPPSEAPQPVTQLPGGKPLKKLALRREAARCRKAVAEMYSLRVSALYQLSIARHVSDRVFWFPHNMDFRGRTYPCAPHFNHLGGDLMRAVLLFAEGKPLGPRGLDWLKIHLINLTGLKKKENLRGRLAYANEIMGDVLDSADKPLTGKKWWMGTDEPWQVLACCMEIAKAVRSSNPESYISHLPVHQDGSCNGLQHYAALGRDVIGAASVNLAPCSVPQDVYSEVAAKVEMLRKQDAAMEVKIAQVLDGFITRKVVKQTVMTVVYGVTRYGGRLQIEKRLKEVEDFPQEHTWEASHYLVQLVFSSLKQMFSGTREIQAWLTESARLISKSGRTVEWVTPLGLPIIQPYHCTKNLVLKCNLQSVILSSSYDVNQKPSTLKQKNAFPPNFIHSLDSTHMMLTALHCLRQGLTFVSVHDCYWTHALTVDIMNRVCRDQFVELHKQPILEDLSRFMLHKYCANTAFARKNKKTEQFTLEQLLSKIPEKGDFDLENVKKSTYFFS